MPRSKREKLTKKSGITEYARKNSMVKVATVDVAQCWCRGFSIGCGKVLSASSHSRHARKERERAEKGKRIIRALINALTRCCLLTENIPHVVQQYMDSLQASFLDSNPEGASTCRARLCCWSGKLIGMRPPTRESC